jgi:broad specificity phosphatase PhoE
VRKLFLIKHAKPNIKPGVPAHSWLLSAEGYEGSKQLAWQLANQGICWVASSDELKASETGHALAQELGVRFAITPGLYEHRRAKVRWEKSQERFEAAVWNLFRHPAEVVFGEESADQAHRRFAAAVADVMMNERDTGAIVAHGTVITLLVARANSIQPFTFWKALGFLGVVELEWPSLKLLRQIEVPV